MIWFIFVYLVYLLSWFGLPLVFCYYSGLFLVFCYHDLVHLCLFGIFFYVIWFSVVLLLFGLFLVLLSFRLSLVFCYHDLFYF